MNLTWTIVNNPDPFFKIRIVTTPEIEPITYFFSSVLIDRIPDLLDSGVKSVGFFTEKAGLLYPSDADGGDIVSGQATPDGMVRVFHEIFGEYLINEEIFDRMTVDYCSRILDIYIHDDEVDDLWRTEVKKGIKLLQDKLSS